MPLDQGVLDAVTNSNFKTLGELVASNAASHQNRLNLIAESSLGQILTRLNTLDPTEAMSIGSVIQSDMPKALAELGAAISSIQQFVKGANTTPPVT